MGVSSVDNLNELKEKQKHNESLVNQKINHYKNEIERISSSINVQKFEIFDKMDKEENYQINNEVSNYFNLLNEKETMEDYLKSSENIKLELEEFSKELKKEKKKNKEEVDKLKKNLKIY